MFSRLSGATCPTATVLTIRTSAVSRCLQLTNISVERIATRCLILESLSVAGCFQVTDDAFLNIGLSVVQRAADLVEAASAEASSASQVLPLPLQRLDTLDVSHTGIGDASLNIIGAVVSFLPFCTEF